MVAISGPAESSTGNVAAAQAGSATPAAGTAQASALLWSAAAVLIVIVAGLIKIEVPVYGDQALFLSYAEDIARGQRLYVDIWDVKPPGIFAFYYAGGQLFGFTDLGIHTFELLWMTALAVLVLAGIKPYLHQQWVAAVAPIASIGVYYANCAPHEQTQIEALVNLPVLTAAIALTAAAGKPTCRSAFAALAGFAAAVATLFKVVFAPIFIVFVLITSVSLLRDGGRRRVGDMLLRLWLPFAAAVSITWLAVFGAFELLGTAQAMLWTIFAYPFAALADVELAPLKRLVVDLRMFFGHFAPWLVFLPLAAWPRHGRRMPLLVQLAWAWLAIGFVVILLQRTSWWYYHFMLLMVPIGLLAAYGVDRVVATLRHRARLSHRAAMGLSCLLVLPATASLLDPLGETANLLFPPLFMGTKTIDSFKQTYPHYANAEEAAAFVRSREPAGPAMVFETPLINRLAGRARPAPIPGFLWGWILPAQYAHATDTLSADPPPFIFVGTDFADRVGARTPGIVALLAERYQLVWERPYGRWYELRWREPSVSGEAATPAASGTRERSGASLSPQ